MVRENTLRQEKKHRRKEKGSQLIFQVLLMYSRSTGERDDLLFRHFGFELTGGHQGRIICE